MRKINYIKKLTAMKYTKFAIGIVIGVLIAAISIYYASTILFDSAEVGYDNTSSGLTSDNVQDAIDELNAICPNPSPPTVREFDYTGGVQKYVVLVTGTYKLQVWGASGGKDAGTYGGLGGYSEGTIYLTAGTTLYVVVGGVGKGSVTGTGGGYNGGGNAGTSGTSGAGGGATHIATQSGTLANLGASNLSKILIVAGGGAGQGGSTNYNGSGGGFKGVTSSGGGGTQTAAGTGTSAGSFGQGGNRTSGDGGGGGGGLYGGGAATSDATGGGGSGYIGNSALYNKKMVCYNCTTSSVKDTKTTTTTCISDTKSVDCSKRGNGYAIITYIY